MPPEDDRASAADLESLKWIGPQTAPVLRDADITSEDVHEKRVSHARLVEAGVNPGVAAKIRREHSLSWSFSGGKDLDRRAKQVRGLQDDERAWVAASAGSWEEVPSSEEASADGRGSSEDEESTWQRRSWPNHDEAEEVETAEIAWREASAPKSVVEIGEIGENDAELLAEAGITSIRSLATASPERVADSLDLDEGTVRRWRETARSMDQ